MHPVLFELGPIPIRSYGFMMMVGFLVSIWLTVRRARRSGANEEVILNIALISMVGGVVGARLFYVIQYWDKSFARMENPIAAAFNVTSGGLVFYGGLLLAIAAVVIYIFAKRLSLRWYMDMITPAVMLGLAFGRIGCFLNGCCWGAACPANVPIGVQFPYGSPPFVYQWLETHEVQLPEEFLYVFNKGTGETQPLPRSLMSLTQEEFEQRLTEAEKHNESAAAQLQHLKEHLDRYGVTIDDLRSQAATMKTAPVYPTQLMSAVNAFLLSFLLATLYWRRKRHGMVVVALFILYPIARFLLEVIRTDVPSSLMGLTVSQQVSVGMIVLGVLLWLYLRTLPLESPLVAQEKAKLAELATQQQANKK